MNKKRDTQKYRATLAAEDNSELSNPEGRLRYYEITGTLSEELEKKKEIQIFDPTKQIQINEIKEDKSLIKENKHELETVYDCDNVKKKVSISYIPIDHF